MKIEIRKTSNKLSCQIFYVKMVSNQIHLWLYSTGDKHLSKFHQELWFPKSHNHVQYFPRVSWPAFTEMPMWPLSPLSGLPLISVMAPFMLYNVHSTLSVIWVVDSNQMIITDSQIRLQRSSSWPTTFYGNG